jgi:hypothetical protein
MAMNGSLMSRVVIGGKPKAFDAVKPETRAEKFTTV